MSFQKKLNRRSLLKLGFGAVAGTISSKLLAFDSENSPCEATPKDVSGPFYPTQGKGEKDVDLTVLQGHTDRAEGQIIHVRGRVLDNECNPVAGAMVEIWQANKWGRYNHEEDPNPAPLDSNFQGWGQAVTDEKGHYGFKTIFPGSYPAEANWTRPPHIHFRVARRGYHELVTQMYFAGQKLNNHDRLLLAIPEEDRRKLIVDFDKVAQNIEAGAKLCHFDLTLQRFS